jgi:outer membrane protein
LTRFTLALAAYVLPAAAVAQTPPPLSLPQAMQRALRGNPSLARLSHLAGAASERVREARAGWMPSVAIVASATDGPTGAPAFGVTGIAGDPLKKHYGAGVNVVQTLFDFGRTGHLVAARTALLRAAEQDTATQTAQVLVAVQEAYLDVLRRQQLVAVREAVVTQREAAVQQAQTFVTAGLTADVDLQLAKADLAEAQGALAAARNDVRAGFAALNSVMGDTSLAEYTLSPSPATTAPPSSVESLMDGAVRNRPELKSAALQVEAAEQSMRSARSDLLPRFDGIASLGAVNPSKLVLENKDYAVGLSITAPLYTGGAVEGRIAEERERREAAAALHRETAEAIKLQVARAFVNVQTREAQLAAARDQAAAARSSQQQAAERYRLQLTSIVELTAAEAAAARAETAAVNAEFDLQTARAELGWATGAILVNAPKAAK